MRYKQICTLEGYEDVRTGYYITDTGKVFSTCDAHRKDKPFECAKELKLYSKFDYFVTALVTVSGRVKYARVNRLVALAFVSGKTVLRCYVNHIDENKQNNDYTNLEWVTPSENNLHSLGRAVYQYNSDGDLVRAYPAVKFTECFGFNAGHVASVCRCEERSHKGFVFSYVELNHWQVLQRLSKPFYMNGDKRCKGK